MLGKVSSVLPFIGKSVELILSGISASSKQEEHGFGKGFNTALSLLSFLAELRNGMSSEGDSADGVKGGAIVEHDW